MNGRVWRSRQQRNGIEPNSFHNMACNDYGILWPRIPKLVVQVLKKYLLKIVWLLASNIRQNRQKMNSFLVKTRPNSISSKTASNFIGRFDYDKWFWFQIKTWRRDWIWTFILIGTKLHNRSYPMYNFTWLLSASFHLWMNLYGINFTRKGKDCLESFLDEFHDNMYLKGSVFETS
jgi:hypothetical protein